MAFFKGNYFKIGKPSDRVNGEKNNPIFIFDHNKRKVKRVQTWKQYSLYQKKQKNKG